MGDPIIGIKCFCLGIVMLIALYVVFILAKLYRVTCGKIKLLPSSLETWLFVAMTIDVIMCVICLLWSAIAWIVS